MEKFQSGREQNQSTLNLVRLLNLKDSAAGLEALASLQTKLLLKKQCAKHGRWTGEKRMSSNAGLVTSKDNCKRQKQT